jgi:transcriptional regulator with XRE-family HTH domain
MAVHKYCDNPQKQQRQRGMMLSDIGLQKLENARNLAEKLENKGDRFTLEELSERTQISIDTLAKVFAGNRNVDKATLKSCFSAFGLTLDPQDCYQPTHYLDLRERSISTAKASEFVPLELLKNYQSDKRQRRRRGVILSSQGRQKLQRAKAEVEYQEKRGNRLTLEELSGRTKISIDTLTKVFAGDNNVDKKTLISCFLSFGLTLDPQDYYQPFQSVDLEDPSLLNEQVPLNCSVG